jgi:predicted amidophosphoribosyltransferase
MAGKVCPGCGKQTFFKSNEGRRCSKCGTELKVPANNGKGGKGAFCCNCDKYQIFDGKCRNCGAVLKIKSQDGE